jgi:hypothetical protein
VGRVRGSYAGNRSTLTNGKQRREVGGAGGNRTPNPFVSTGFTRLTCRQNRLELYGFAGFRTISYKNLRSALDLDSPLIEHSELSAQISNWAPGRLRAQLYL